MSELAEQLAYTEEPQYGYITNEPGVVDETWKYIAPLAIGARGLINSGLNLYNSYKPYFNDI